jgi:hypothetical protein
MSSDEEQLQMSDHIQHCPLIVCDFLRIELSSLKVRFAGGFGTGGSLLCGTCLTAESKSGYFTVCLDLEVILLCMLNKSSNQMSGPLVPSKPREQ